MTSRNACSRPDGELGQQRVGVDDAAARDVDDHGAVGQGGEERGVHQARSSRRCWGSATTTTSCCGSRSGSSSMAVHAVAAAPARPRSRSASKTRAAAATRSPMSPAPSTSTRRPSRPSVRYRRHSCRSLRARSTRGRRRRTASSPATASSAVDAAVDAAAVAQRDAVGHRPAARARRRPRAAGSTSSRGSRGQRLAAGGGALYSPTKNSMSSAPSGGRPCPSQTSTRRRRAARRPRRRRRPSSVGHAHRSRMPDPSRACRTGHGRQHWRIMCAAPSPPWALPSARRCCCGLLAVVGARRTSGPAPAPAASRAAAACTSSRSCRPRRWVRAPTGPAVACPAPSSRPAVCRRPGSRKQDPLVVATKLTAPVGLTLLPDGTALVGERTTGRIVRVQPRAGQPVPTVRTLTGLDTSGGGGLLDLALSPNYAEDNLIFAYVTTPTDNRVVDFTLNGPGHPGAHGHPARRDATTPAASRSTPTAPCSSAPATPDGPHWPQSATSLAGKILRVADIGRPATGNPTPARRCSPPGSASSTGLCAGRRPAARAPVEPRGARAGRPDQRASARVPTTAGRRPVAARSARWPRCPTTARRPRRLRGARRHALHHLARRQGLLAAPLAPSQHDGRRSGRSRPCCTTRYGRLRTVVPAADGALWITTSNRDGQGNPVAADERRHPLPTTGVRRQRRRARTT